MADYHLDGGSLGMAAIDMLHQCYGSDVPALVISGNRSEALEAEIRALGHGFLRKPVAPAKLRAMLSEGQMRVTEGGLARPQGQPGL